MAHYVAVEGFPAAGKSELLSAVARYYPEQVVVLPELVREVVESQGIDLFKERERLTEALLAALPDRQRMLHELVQAERLVVEDAHLGVHAAYAGALADHGFLDAFAGLEPKLLWPETYIRLELPVEASLRRQRFRADAGFWVGDAVLRSMGRHLATWHMRLRNDVLSVNANRAPAEVLEELTGVLGLNYVSAASDVLPYVILLGRPASGKSELIQFLVSLSPDERAEEYRLGPLVIQDDFPILWDKFVEDDDWEAVGRGRLLSAPANGNYYVTDDLVWPFLIRRLNRRLEAMQEAPGSTVLVEFARGGDDGYRSALEALSPRVLERAGVVYVDVSYEESCRRNRARYDEARRAGLLTHSVPEHELARTYATDDWHTLAQDPTGYLDLGSQRVPYVTVPNTPEPTTADAFAERYRPVLAQLYSMWKAGR